MQSREHFLPLFGGATWNAWRTWSAARPCSSASPSPIRLRVSHRRDQARTRDRPVSAFFGDCAHPVLQIYRRKGSLFFVYAKPPFHLSRIYIAPWKLPRTRSLSGSTGAPRRFAEEPLRCTANFLSLVACWYGWRPPPRMRRMHLPHRPAQPRRWLSRDRPTSTRWVTTYSPVSSIIISWSGA